MNVLAKVLLLCLLGIFGWVPITLAGMPISFENQLNRIRRDEFVRKEISGAKFRVGVFTYEDPDGTGLGDALSELVAHYILVNTHVSSIGALIFVGGLAPSKSSTLSYFDKVEKVATAQETVLSVWGSVRHDAQDLLIETYIQIPESTVSRYMTARISFAEGLVARMRPDRFAIQRLRVPVSDIDYLKRAAKRIKEMRIEPFDDASVKSVLETGQLFYFVRRQGDWARIAIRGGSSGWVPLRVLCRNRVCHPLHEAAKFASYLLTRMEKHNYSLVPGSSLTTEALAVSEQYDALRALESGQPEKALRIASKWYGAGRLMGPDAKTGIDRGRNLAPGGATFANIAVLSQIETAIGSSETARVDKELAREAAFQLAVASQYDPRNSDVLRNLDTLFEYAGDSDRAELARNLAVQ